MNDEQLPMSYRPLFGPDAGDVQTLNERVAAIIWQLGPPLTPIKAKAPAFEMAGPARRDQANSGSTRTPHGALTYIKAAPGLTRYAERGTAKSEVW